METLTEVLEEQVQDLYNAENQLAKALPKMAKKATTLELRDAFTNHLEQTKEQIERLKQVAEMLEIKPTGKVCKAMKGLIEEGREVLEEDGKNEAIDAALIAAAQRIEHYEISAYGTVIALANAVGETKITKLFQQTLDEESETDELLTKVAEDSVYPNAHKTEADTTSVTDSDKKPASRKKPKKSSR